jgi:hypothetical protein
VEGVSFLSLVSPSLFTLGELLDLPSALAAEGPAGAGPSFDLLLLVLLTTLFLTSPVPDFSDVLSSSPDYGDRLSSGSSSFLFFEFTTPSFNFSMI